MLGQKLFEEISSRVGATIAASPVKDIEKNIRSMIAHAFIKMDLVTREEFDIQQQVLIRTREKLVAIEERLARIEAQSLTQTDEPARSEVMQERP